MARKSSIEKNDRKLRVALKYFEYRKQLREKSVDVKASDEEKSEARKKLQSLPRNTSISRVTTRCKLTGRPRGNYRKFGLSRMKFRELALAGKLPGVTKASW